MFKIRTLNAISVAGLERLPRDRYEVASDISQPDAILLRSHDLHATPVPDSVRAVARAGAGVNNIPVASLSARGVPVFNTPGANANAVKELVIAGMLLAARGVCQAWRFVRELDVAPDELESVVEAGKRQFRGFELPGRTLGVIGLGAIGVRVANAGVALDMAVIGFDPAMTVTRAWQLSSGVRQANSLGELLERSDFVSVHVPMSDSTRGLVSADRLAAMKSGATLINFSRAGVVDEQALLERLDEQHLHAYVTDFPTSGLVHRPGVIALPHIGASTREAEDNCAIMAADQLRAFLEDGTVRNSVNFPEVEMPRNGGARIAIANANVPNMLGQISTTLARAGLNIVDMLNKSKGDMAYTLVDVETEVPEPVLQSLRAIEGVLSVHAP